MGTFFTECIVSNQAARQRQTPRRLLVDMGEVGFALINTAGRITTDEVVFALEDDLQLMGARSRRPPQPEIGFT